MFSIIVLTFTAKANIVLDTLFINKDTVTITGFNYEICVFNDSANFKPLNHVFELAADDTLQLHIINNDTLSHTFTIDGFISSGNTISALGTADFQVVLPNNGAYRYYSDVPYGKLLGASGVILKGYPNYPKFYWNMFEQSDTLSYEIADLSVSNTPIDYTPNVFSINFKTHPALITDMQAKVIGNVGDTLLITVINSGQMEHTLHFHGYHVTIMNATMNTKMLGWSKDSFPLEIGEIVVVRLVPHQDGLYPVHEHNLINVTNFGVYPGGMLNIIDIQP